MKSSPSYLGSSDTYGDDLGIKHVFTKYLKASN